VRGRRGIERDAYCGCAACASAARLSFWRRARLGNRADSLALGFGVVYTFIRALFIGLSWAGNE
jgi:hypothetical protein